jgi:predicted transcriptional regulator
MKMINVATVINGIFGEVEMKRMRSKWDVILAILKVIQEEEKVKKTRIMQRAYLDWRNFQRYFDFLLAEGFITKCNPIPEYYEITENGRNLSEKLKGVAEMLDSSRIKR